MIMLKITLIFLLSCIYCHAGRPGENQGETYIRWGKTSCPEESSLVYDGYAAGKHYNKGGSGSNLLCLPKNPEWKDYTNGENRWSGKLYGVEYGILQHKPYPYSFHNKDTPCAVCQSTRSTVLMVPGKVTCYTGWHKEFSGYLMSQISTNGRMPSEYVCVDEKLEYVPGGDSDDNQAILYTVEAMCGSLKCPPYVNGRELTCVVCSK
ncbi:short-chain collagen C4-like [Mytilus trossulus]|uniref:short-chain collagen C4-like n=1 Tax=Mytilus trossulus TaxID=6551 RepID=UPI003007D91A